MFGDENCEAREDVKEIGKRVKVSFSRVKCVLVEGSGGIEDKMEFFV